MRAGSQWLGLALCLSMGVAQAAEPPADMAPAAQGFGVGPAYRYDERALPGRFLLDLVAMPASVPRWDVADWAVFGVTTGSVLWLMAPPAPSADVRFQRWVNEHRPPVKRQILTPLGDSAIWGVLWGATGVTFLVGHLQPNVRYRETVSLMIEAWAVAEVYQLVFKLGLGREGPENGQGLGVIRGPAEGFGLFPSGTPSGHAATYYAMLGVVTAYWDNPWLSTSLHALGLLFSGLLVWDNYHFVSDVIWGAVMGYTMGRWVVKHRASHAPTTADPKANASAHAPATPALTYEWGPQVMPHQGIGFGLVGTF